MKIVFIGGRSVHILGGIENYMLNLTRELNRLGHECIIWCESDHDGEENIDGVRVIYQYGPKNNLICKPWCSLKATLKTVFRIKGVSFIHYNAWPPSLWSWIPRLAGIPSLMEGHGLEWQRSKYSPTARKVLKFMEKVTAYSNHHLAMCSKDQVEYFRQTYGVESVCIPGAVNLPSEESEGFSDILERYGLQDKKFFLFMGRFVQDKNPDYLIRAFIQSEHQDMKLVLAGSNDAMPEYVDSLHQQAKDCPDVVFTGAVYGKDKSALLRHAYCFCLPSTIEGLSIVMLEAASYHLPILASDIEANKEFLKDDAIYVRPENEGDLVEALERAISNPELLHQYEETNYQKILDNYTWDKTAKKYVDYLRSIGVKG